MRDAAPPPAIAGAASGRRQIHGLVQIHVCLRALEAARAPEPRWQRIESFSTTFAKADFTVFSTAISRPQASSGGR
jgi:hypothetical protein